MSQLSFFFPGNPSVISLRGGLPVTAISITRTIFNPDRCPQEPECAANLIF